MDPSSAVTFVEHSDFAHITGATPRATLLASAGGEGLALFHEACIYHKPSRSIFVTSNQLVCGSIKPSAATSDKQIQLLKVYDEPRLKANANAAYELVEFSGWEGAMLNGGVNYGPDKILMCAQGSKDEDDLSGLIALPITSRDSSTKAEILLSSFQGTPFNSVNDIIVHPKDGTIWFTDPCYGYHQGIRNAPQLPNQVYCHDPETGVTRAVADGFTRPNGLCFSPDLQRLYVTDTGAVHGSSEVPFDLQGPAHIYAFDLASWGGRAKPVSILVNKRLFAFAPGRLPDGIKCDTNGNVYSGCRDGIEVWDESGIPLGVIRIKGGVANFCFGDRGVIYACNETKLWKININEGVEGALLAGMSWD